MTTPTAATEITWVGHATALLQFGDHRVLTDPLLTRRVAHLRRRRAAPDVDTADVDTVLLSHIHMDHLHLGSLRRIRPSAHVIAPRGAAGLLRKAGFTASGAITEVSVGDRVTSGPLTIDAVPAIHGDGRGPHSRIRAQPVGYVIDSGERRIYFPGDTDLFAAMSDLGPIDAALLPIWGWGSTLGPGHLDPQRAATAVERIRPEIVIPIHYGTYAPEDGRRRLPRWFGDAPAQFADELANGAHHDRLRLLEPGGALTW